MKYSTSSLACQGKFNIVSNVNRLLIRGVSPYKIVQHYLPVEVYCRATGIHLTRAGSYLKGRCPIHHETNGESFIVKPSTRKWFCNGKCGEKGSDVIDLHSLRANTSSKFAVECLLDWIRGDRLHPFPARLPYEEAFRRFKEEEEDQRENESKWKWNWREHLTSMPESVMRRLAQGRGLPVSCVQEAKAQGLLWMLLCQKEWVTEEGKNGNPSYRGVAEWVITDRSRKQAVRRRIDGALYDGQDKARLLPGCTGQTPIGVDEAVESEHEFAVVVEGGPDLLAAFALWQNPVIMMPNANSRFRKEDIEKLEGKVIRICPHQDEAGQKAMLAWQRQLETAAGIQVEVWQDYRPGAKDLNEHVTRLLTPCQKEKT